MTYKNIYTHILYMLACIIWIIHFIYVLFVLITPWLSFKKYKQIKFIYIFMMPLMLLHWYTNNNICSLTLFEQTIRGTNENCFTCKFINPIYDFSSNYKQFSSISYIVVTILWLVCVHQFIREYCNGNIKSFYDLIV